MEWCLPSPSRCQAAATAPAGASKASQSPSHRAQWPDGQGWVGGWRVQMPRSKSAGSGLLDLTGWFYTASGWYGFIWCIYGFYMVLYGLIRCSCSPSLDFLREPSSKVVASVCRLHICTFSFGVRILGCHHKACNCGVPGCEGRKSRNQVYQALGSHPKPESKDSICPASSRKRGVRVEEPKHWFAGCPGVGKTSCLIWLLSTNHTAAELHPPLRTPSASPGLSCSDRIRRSRRHCYQQLVDDWQQTSSFHAAQPSHHPTRKSASEADATAASLKWLARQQSQLDHTIPG